MDGIFDSVETIYEYFPQLTDNQQHQFAMMRDLYLDWNSRINVISRNDTDNLYVRHVLHSLSIAKFLGNLAAGTKIMDLGCGGGFPGIPLAVLYPGCCFHLIDRIGKKIRVAQSIAESIGLKNVSFQHGDSGECHDKFSYVVSRAVMPLPDLVKACRNNVYALKDAPANTLPPGLVCLKGGDLAAEVASVSKKVIRENINTYFSEPFFGTKQIVYVPL